MRPMKKVRGRVNRFKTMVKVKFVDDAYIISTSFAKYKIPRKYFVTFAKANQKQMQNVVSFFTLTWRFDSNGSYIQSFYWFDLDDVFDIDQFEKFEVTDASEFPANDESWKEAVRSTVQLRFCTPNKESNVQV